MSLKDQLMEEMKNAMRAKDTVRLGVIRFLRSEIKNIEIDHGDQDDAGVLKIIAKQVKSMKDANSEYQKGGREDLVEENNTKIKILEEYLPQQLSNEELETIVKKIVDSAEEKHMGKIIGSVMKEVDGKADGGRVSQLVRKLLS
ncbi:MAG: GatB/YqeY domain-containing protein [Candidatus Pacebacteria bacterium]|nr:GatB/YqeY domain-containing protein [Candidatus Paceibacterota bacterium]